MLGSDLFSYQNARHNVKIANKSFENIFGKVQLFRNISDKHYFIRKLRENYIWGMLAAIHVRIFCLPTSYHHPKHRG